MALIGQRFGYLVVEEYLYSKGSCHFYHCLCNCGKRIRTSEDNLESGRTTSCGHDRVAPRTIHGKSHTPEYRTWSSMRYRYTVPTTVGYKNYGGRGISVCEEWMNNFQAFYDYIGPKPSPRHRIDRIDNDSDYKPGNVKWSTPKEQANNRRKKGVTGD